MLLLPIAFVKVCVDAHLGDVNGISASFNVCPPSEAPRYACSQDSWAEPALCQQGSCLQVDVCKTLI